MAKKKAFKIKEGAASAAPSSVSDGVAETTQAKKFAARGAERAKALLESGLIQPPPLEALADLASLTPRLPPLSMKKATQSAGPRVTPPDAAYAPGMPYGVPHAKRRRFSATFADVTAIDSEARQRATQLRATLGQALAMLDHGYNEAKATLAWLKANPQAVAEFVREGVDLDEVRRFADEADDVLAVFTVREDASRG